MDSPVTIAHVKQPGGGQRKDVPKPPRKDGFAGGKVDPRVAGQLGVAARWGKDRRTLVAMAQEVRPEAFAVVCQIMRDPLVEPPTRLRAGELVLAYSDGKPRQSVDLAISGPREMSSLSRLELEAIARGAPVPFQLAHQGEVIEAECLHAQPTAESVPWSVQGNNAAEI